MSVRLIWSRRRRLTTSGSATDQAEAECNQAARGRARHGSAPGGVVTTNGDVGGFVVGVVIVGDGAVGVGVGTQGWSQNTLCFGPVGVQAFTSSACAGFMLATMLGYGGYVLRERRSGA